MSLTSKGAWCISTGANLLALGILAELVEVSIETLCFFNYFEELVSKYQKVVLLFDHTSC